MTTRNLTCHELDERLGDYLEGTLPDSSVADIELHLSGCAHCAALVRDFEALARDAATLPPMTPSRDLWSGIEARIGTPVVDLSTRARDRVAAPGASATWRRIRTGAIAAGLMGLTAAVTWTMARREATGPVAVAPVGTPAVDASVDRERTLAAAVTPSAAVSTDSNAPDASPSLNASSATVKSVRRESRPAPAATYDQEISQLRGALEERREQLDPRTIAVIESSVATIDSAIAQARAALRRDPASRFLSDQLNKSLEKKLGLLRTAALLPSRT